MIRLPKPTWKSWICSKTNYLFGSAPSKFCVGHCLYPRDTNTNLPIQIQHNLIWALLESRMLMAGDFFINAIHKSRPLNCGLDHCAKIPLMKITSKFCGHFFTWTPTQVDHGETFQTFIRSIILTFLSDLGMSLASCPENDPSMLLGRGGRCGSLKMISATSPLHKTNYGFIFGWATLPIGTWVAWWVHEYRF